MAFATVTVTVDADEEYSSAVQLRSGPDGICRAMVRVFDGGGAAFVGTIALQARLPGESTFQTIKTYSENVWENIESAFSGVEYRIGSTAYTSGTIVCTIFPAR